MDMLYIVTVFNNMCVACCSDTQQDTIRHLYVIVLFTKSNLVDVAPTNWIVNGHICMWPPKSKKGISPSTLAMKRASVKLNFVPYEVELIQGYGKYKKP